jgi:hypothetical protein
MRAILLATVAGVLLAGNVVAHGDWRKNGMTIGDYRKDAQYDFENVIRTKRSSESPPTSAKLEKEGGIRIAHEPGSVFYYIDMYPNYAARIQIEKWYKEVVVPKPEIANVLPTSTCKRPLISDKPSADETTGQVVTSDDDACNVLIIQTNTPGNPNGQTNNGGDNNHAPFTASGGGTVAGTGGSAVATRSMTNILALSNDGQLVANLVITTMPSWQRFDEGKMEIHNNKQLAGYVNYQCDPICRRVRDPSGSSQGNSVQGVGAQGNGNANSNNSNNN